MPKPPRAPLRNGSTHNADPSADTSLGTLVGAGAVGAGPLMVPDHGRRIVTGDPQDMDVCGLTHLHTRTASLSRKRQDKAPAASPPLAPGMRPARLARREGEHSFGARLCPDDSATQMAAAACPFLGRRCRPGPGVRRRSLQARSPHPVQPGLSRWSGIEAGQRPGWARSTRMARPVALTLNPGWRNKVGKGSPAMADLLSARSRRVGEGVEQVVTPWHQCNNYYF
jgi:hypothetical protein